MLACPSGHVIFVDEQEAQNAAQEVERRAGVPVAAVACDQCRFWHVRAITNTR